MAGSPDDGGAGSPQEGVPLEQLVARPAAPEPSVRPDGPGRSRQPKATAEEERVRQLAARLKLANDRRRVEIAEHKERVKRDKEDHRRLWEYRKWYGRAGVVIVVIWQTLVLLLVVGGGRDWVRVSDPVLVALATSTTVSVIGLLVIVMKFVFAPLTPPTLKPAECRRRSRS